jgi:HK97 family phage prohead protease
METRNFAWKIKSVSDDGSGTFTGWASTYGNTDLGGDVVAPGAFAKSIADQGDGVTLLWQHRTDQPIGRGKLSDQQSGLAINGKLLMSDPVARRAYEHLKAGTVRGLSIGYDPMKSTPRPDGGRTLNEVKLYEVSLVTFPMNQAATITGVKQLPDVLQVLEGLSAADLDDDETVDQLHAIDCALKRLLPADPALEHAARLRGFSEIDDALKRLLV